MKKNLLIILFGITVLSFSGCANAVNIPSGQETSQEEEVKDEAGTGKNADDKDKNTDDEEWVGLDDENSKEAPSNMTYSYRSNPVELDDGDDVLVQANYISIDLGEENASAYPELASRIGEINDAAANDMTSYVKSSEEEVQEMRKDDRDVSYEEDRFFHPMRADNKAFSFIVESYSFCGGAHGMTAYIGYNIDPGTGKDIKFDDVIKDKKSLPQIIMDELIVQNDDLEDYFDTAMDSKDQLMDDLMAAFEGGGTMPAWAVGYNGIKFCFDDYAMGSYVAGARSVLIAYENHPDVFTDKFLDENKDVPDIEDHAKKEDDAQPQKIEASKKAAQEKPAAAVEDAEEIELPREQQRKLNVFLSNFAEQNMYVYDEEVNDMQHIADFAYVWSRINRPADVETEGNYYKISFETIKRLAKKYFGRKITENDMNSYPWKDVKDKALYEDGYYLVPAADGESYTKLAIAQSVEDEKDGTWKVNFITYDLDLDVYWDNNETIPKKYYSMSTKEAAEDKDLTADSQGYAVVRNEGGSFTLSHYEVY